MKNIVRNTKGFTLIELMIVIAIIGILAAIAIPQFAAYRMRSYNAAATSDVRNLNTNEAAIFADWQRYGTTNPADAYVDKDGELVDGGDTTVDYLATVDVNGTTRTIQIPISNGVTAIAKTEKDAAAGLDNAPATFNAASKHIQADTYYAVDGDSVNLYQKQDKAKVGTKLVAGDCVTPTTPDIDFTAADSWVVK